MMSSGQRRLPELDDRLADMYQIERNHQSMGNGFFFFSLRSWYIIGGYIVYHHKSSLRVSRQVIVF